MFTGRYIIPGPDPDPTLTGTLNDGCTGWFDDFGIFGGIQPFIYNTDTCSIIFLNTGNVFRSRRTECTGLTPGNINIISKDEPWKNKKCNLTVIGIFWLRCRAIKLNLTYSRYKCFKTQIFFLAWNYFRFLFQLCLRYQVCVDVNLEMFLKPINHIFLKPNISKPQL